MPKGRQKPNRAAPATSADSVLWTAEDRARVWPWRGHPNDALDREDIEELRDVKACFQDWRKWIDYDHGRKKNWYVAGRARVDPALLPLTDAVLEEAVRKTLPKAALDCETHAALVSLEIVPLFAGVALWIAKEGIGFAIKTLVRCHALTSSAHEHGYSDRGVWLVPDVHGGAPEYADSAWRTIRILLGAMPDKEYKAAVSAARGEWKAAPPVARSLMAIAFATEREWADEAAKQVLAQKYRHGYVRDLVTVASIEHGTELAKAKDWCISEDAMLTLLAREGAGATPVIAAALGAAGNNEWRKTYAKLLARIDTDEAARAFVPWISNRTVNAIAMKVYERNPERARRVLTPIAKGKSEHAKSAGTALKSL